jgi:hypothetical protein
MTAGWLNANENSRMSEIKSEMERKIFNEVGIFITILLEEVSPDCFPYQSYQFLEKLSR